MDKSQLRKLAKQQRLAMPLDDVANAIIQHLESWPVFQQARTIACYSALTHEINLLPLMEAHAGKQWFLPKVLNEQEMIFLPYQPNASMTSGYFGIFEPHAEETDEINETPVFDLIIVPALVVDREGNRLGHGKGYYDRVLSAMDDTVVKLSAIPNDHYTESLAPEPHDVPMQFVVTESGVSPLGQ